MIWFLPTVSALSSASHDLIFLLPRYPVLQSHGKIHTSKHATPLPFPSLYALFPFTKLVPLPSLPALWHMSWNSFSCLHASLSLWSMNSRMMTPLLSSKTSVVPNTGQRLRKHQIDEWMGSRRILWSFNWSPLPSARSKWWISLALACMIRCEASSRAAGLARWQQTLRGMGFWERGNRWDRKTSLNSSLILRLNKLIWEGG